MCSCGKHATFGACIRAKNITVSSDTRKGWDRELELYRSAREQGIQPASTRTASSREALDLSDRSGAAWDASGGVGVD